MSKKSQRRNQINCHHKIGQSLRKDFEVDDARNKIMMSLIEHEHFHGFFKMNLTPKSQYSKMKEFTESTMSELAIALLDQLINLSDEDFYAPGLVKNGKHRTTK